MASPLALAMMTPQGYSPGTLQPTNVENAYAISQDAAEKNYQAKLAQQNAMWGGLAGLGSAGIMAAPKLFGAGGPLAPAAAGASSAAPAAFGGMNVTGLPGLGFDATSAGTALGAAAPSVATDIAAAAPAAADAAGSFSIADIIPLLASIFAA